MHVKTHLRGVMLVLSATLLISILSSIVTMLVFTVYYQPSQPASSLNILFWTQIISLGLFSSLFCGLAAYLAKQAPMRHVGAIVGVLSVFSLPDIFAGQFVFVVALIGTGVLSGLLVTNMRRDGPSTNRMSPTARH